MSSVHLDRLHSDPEPVQWLDGQQVLSEEEVGWKAAILSEIHRTGGAVPPGFVISPGYFHRFLQGLSLPLDPDFLSSPVVQSPPALQLWTMAEALQAQVDTLVFPPQWEGSLRSAYQQLREAFPNALYILRPSIVPPRDWPQTAPPFQTTGLLEAVLDPPGDGGEASLWLQFCQSLRSLYRQCFQARSLLYWDYHQEPLTHLPVAVLVQPLLPALATGTIEITAQDVTITATWGVGLSLTRGEIVPDRYCWNRSEPTPSPTVHLGQKSWVYWHPDTPQALNLPVEIPLPAPRSSPASGSPLMVQRVALGAQHQAVLTASQLRDLETQALALQKAIPQINTLVWVFCPSLSDPSHLSIVWVQGNPAPVCQTPESRADVREFTSQELTPIQGQGVSGGVQVGRVCGLETLVLQPPLNPDLPLILVVQQLTPEVLPWLARVSGLVLAQGGATSHGAILAREYQIPAVVGVGTANLEYLRSFPWIKVDGDGGLVQGLREEPPSAIADRRVSGSDPDQPLAQEESSDSLVDPTPTAVPLRIFATLNQMTSLSSFTEWQPDGVGLLRSEWFFLDLWKGQHPHRWISQNRQEELRSAHQARLQQCIQAIHPRPLFYRSVDCRAAELQSLAGQDTFPWDVGGTFAHCFEPSVLTLELEVLHQIDRCGSPLHLVLPMVRTVEEFICCRDRYQQFVQEHGLQDQSLPLWIMAEVPSILLQLPAFAQAGVQGLVIGPGDLSHYLLGLNRERSGPLIYELHHPIVHQAIVQLLREAQHLKIPTILSSHSGNIPPTHLEDYVQAGLWGITTELPHLKTLRQTIVRSRFML